jgi:hypothetical protein
MWITHRFSVIMPSVKTTVLYGVDTFRFQPFKREDTDHHSLFYLITLRKTLTDPTRW